MQDPSPRKSRLILTAAFAAAIAVGGAGFVLGQRAATERAAVVVAPPVPAPLPTLAPAETIRRVLGRQDLVLLAAVGADAAARGVAMPTGVGAQVGDRFSIALPFGCEGPAAADSEARMRWRYDADAGALRLHVAPVEWSTGEWSGIDVAAAETEAAAAVEPEAGAPGGGSVEGFWIARPWANSEACTADDPLAANVFDPLLLPAQTLAIGQYFGGEDSRRDRRAYTNVVRMAADAVRGEKGFRLRLKGRVAEAPWAGGSVACQQPGGADQRPICLVLATFDAVSIENAATGETLAIWDVAASGRNAGGAAAGTGAR